MNTTLLSRLLVQQLVQAHNKEIIKGPHHWLFVSRKIFHVILSSRIHIPTNINWLVCNIPMMRLLYDDYDEEWERRVWFHDGVIKWKHFPRYWPLWGEFTVHRWIPRTKASDAELWYFLWSERLSKQSGRRWFYTPSRPLWRHCNAILICRIHLYNPQGCFIGTRAATKCL